MTLAMKKPDQSGSRPLTPSVKAPSGAGPFVEKRRETRYEICEAVEVSILEMPVRCLQGVLRDVSRSGFRLELSEPVVAGARLEVVLRNQAIIFGEARYCRHSAGTYQVGVVIEDIYYPKPVSVTNVLEDRRSLDYLRSTKSPAWIASGVAAPGPSAENSPAHIDLGFGRVAKDDPKAPEVIREPAAGFAQRSAAPGKDDGCGPFLPIRSGIEC
jgi:hypothetical protein